MINSNGVLLVKNADLSNDSYTIQVSVTDSKSTPIIIFVVIDVNRINDPPIMEDQVFSIPENSDEDIEVGTVIATDPEGDAIEYRIISGTDYFRITPSGTLTLKDNLFDFETRPSFEIKIRATDAFDLSVEAILTIELEDRNDSPVISNQQFTIQENSAGATSIGQVVATDQDNSIEELVYAITNNPTSMFSMTNMGELVLESADLDYETESNYTITISVTDPDGLVSEATIEISVIDVNEVPVIAALDTVFVEEYTPIGSSVIYLNATDPDGQTLTFEIESGDGSAFTINSSSGEVTTSGELIYSHTSVYTIAIKVSDDLLSSITYLHVSLIDLDEKGTFVDSRDSKLYPWVRIGYQIWMAENLAYLPSVDSVGNGSETCTVCKHYYVYDYVPPDTTEQVQIDSAKNTVNYSLYGVLYNWNASVNGALPVNTVPSGIQGVCPDGWHVPSHLEWVYLENYIGVNHTGSIGGALKDTTGWSASSYTGFDLFGFKAVPGGKRVSSGSYSSRIYYTFYWSTSDFDGDAVARFLANNSYSIYTNQGEANNGYSVRCIKD